MTLNSTARVWWKRTARIGRTVISLVAVLQSTGEAVGSLSSLFPKLCHLKQWLQCSVVGLFAT